MILSLLQLSDSALPIGGYSHSWGLEAAIDNGTVCDAASLEQWVRLWLQHSLGPFEGVIVAAACRAMYDDDWPTVGKANHHLEIGLNPTTLRHASQEMGDQLLALAESWPWAVESLAWFAENQKPKIKNQKWHHAVVFAILAASQCSAYQALAAYLHQAALGMIGAGVRGIPIGHTHGQQILARLHSDLYNLSEELVERGLETAGSSCPAYEVFCYEQTQLYSRLFRS